MAVNSPTIHGSKPTTKVGRKRRQAVGVQIPAHVRRLHQGDRRESIDGKGRQNQKPSPASVKRRRDDVFLIANSAILPATGRHLIEGGPVAQRFADKWVPASA